MGWRMSKKKPFYGQPFQLVEIVLSEKSETFHSDQLTRPKRSNFRLNRNFYGGSYNFILCAHLAFCTAFLRDCQFIRPCSIKPTEGATCEYSILYLWMVFSCALFDLSKFALYLEFDAFLYFLGNAILVPSRRLGFHNILRQLVITTFILTGGLCTINLLSYNDDPRFWTIKLFQACTTLRLLQWKRIKYFTVKIALQYRKQ